MAKQWDVFVYGDVNIDLVVPNIDRLPAPGSEEETDEMRTFVGGGAALFALGLAKLGARCVFQGAVGRDMYGAFIRDTFRHTGVDDAYLKDDPQSGTGISISFTNARDRCFLTYRGTNGQISLTRLDFEALSRARHIHMTGYAGKSNHAEYAHALKAVRDLQDITVSLDVGWDPDGEWYEGIFDLLPLVDVVFMNETECAHYTRRHDPLDGALRLAEKAKIAAVKLGSKGALAVTGGKSFSHPGFPVRAVDTTGAGDSFNAGFVYGYLKNLPPEECLRMGNACGALCVTALGGNTAFPDLPRLQAWMNEQEGGRNK